MLICFSSSWVSDLDGAENLVLHNLVADILGALTVGVLYVVDPLKLNIVGVLRVFDDIDVAILTKRVTKFECAQLFLFDEFHINNIFMVQDLFVLLVIWLKSEASCALHCKHHIIVKLDRAFKGQLGIGEFDKILCLGFLDGEVSTSSAA